MRAGACAAQQTLSAEAASVLKHSLSLARRRSHAQLTPLHVAATLLSSRASILTRACLKSQPHQPSHPLHCRALELCFNVALNRLPATSGPPLLVQPSLSNALIAALKRAQAHQRRGCIEQQHPLIAIKVELEQLILSMLDDPSVSRVMREAGFSSTSVKNNLDDSNSISFGFHCYNTFGGIYSTPNSPPTPNSFLHSHLLPFVFSSHNKPMSNCTTDHASCLKEDINVVLDVLLGKKRRNCVIVGDSLSMAEKLVAQVMDKVEKGDVPEELKSAQLIKFQFFSSVPLRLMKREELDMNVTDLKRKVESFASGGKVIIYIGDLKWTVGPRDGDEMEGGLLTGKESTFYSPIDHLIAEIGKLLSWYNNSSNMKVWLIATANYQTYIKCQMKQPPLDVQWTLQAVSVPSGGLGLSLNATSGLDTRITFSQNLSQSTDRKQSCDLKEEQDVLTCSPECKSNYEKEAGFHSILHKSFSPPSINKDKENYSAQLPHWLKPHQNDTFQKEDLVEFRNYNKMCQHFHHGNQYPHNSSSAFSNQCYLGKNYFYNDPSCPSWPNKKNIFADSETMSFAYPAVMPNQSASFVPRFRRQQSCHIEFSFSNGIPKYQSVDSNLDSFMSMEEKEVKISLTLGNSTYSDSPKPEKVADLCGIFQENVPWQSENIPLILEALIDSEAINQDKFLLLQGNDNVGKRRLAVGIAKSMFGSSDLLFCMNMRNNDNTVAENREMLEKALKNHEKLVILVEDVDCADPEFAKFLADGFEAGESRGRRRNGDSGSAVFILTMDGDHSRENINSVIQMKLLVDESVSSSGLPNLGFKRKADYDLPIRSKSRRNHEMEEVSSYAFKNGKREFTRKLSLNSLDLNMEADEGEPGEFSPISSDLTREIAIEQDNSPRFILKKIKNCFVLNRNSHGDAREMFMAKFKRLASGYCRNIRSFDVEETVLEKILRGSGLYLNSLFDEWLKDIFETSLLRVSDNGERGMVSVRLCLGEIESYDEEDGFMGTCLPINIPVSFLA